MTFSAEVGGVQSSVLVDTGSTINLLSNTVLYDVLPNKAPLLTTKTKARTVGRDNLTLLGKNKVAVKFAGEVVAVPFYVSDEIETLVNYVPM